MALKPAGRRSGETARVACRVIKRFFLFGPVGFEILKILNVKNHLTLSPSAL